MNNISQKCIGVIHRMRRTAGHPDCFIPQKRQTKFFNTIFFRYCIRAFNHHNISLRCFQKRIDGRSLSLPLILSHQENLRIFRGKFPNHTICLVCAGRRDHHNASNHRVRCLLLQKCRKDLSDISPFIVSGNANRNVYNIFSYHLINIGAATYSPFS